MLAGVLRRARELVKKIEEVHASEEHYRVWATAQMHLGSYKGPTYKAELDALKKALATDE